LSKPPSLVIRFGFLCFSGRHFAAPLAFRIGVTSVVSSAIRADVRQRPQAHAMIACVRRVDL